MSWLEYSNKLTRTVFFKTQTELGDFLVKIAKIADKMNHHPDYIIQKCSELTILLTTHDAKEITEKDYQLANKIDEELRKLSLD